MDILQRGLWVASDKEGQEPSHCIVNKSKLSPGIILLFSLSMRGHLEL